MESRTTEPTGLSLLDSSGRYVMRKLPQMTVLSWVIKIVALALGEASGDLFWITLKIGYGTTELVFLAWWCSGQACDVENIASRKDETLTGSPFRWPTPSAPPAVSGFRRYASRSP